MSQVDWSKAPEWAKAYGVAGGSAMWVGDDRYAYTERPLKTYAWAARSDNPAYRHRSELTLLIERPAAWNGEGLPPVGTVCEFTGTNECGSNVEQLRQGAEVTIIAHYEQNNGEPLAAFTFIDDEGEKRIGGAMATRFAPIRTPEQIAAEERKLQKEQLAYLIAGYMGFDDPREVDTKLAAYIFDHEYRKQVAP